MPYGDLSVGLAFDKTENTRFSYACGACNRCCEGKAIRVGPYEVLRLARGLGLSTTEFISRHTQSGGTVLLVNSENNCSFLGPNGCTVHKDRPLACRLYPLGMQIGAEGHKQFCSLHPHPETLGRYGVAGTVADYLATQGVEPYFAANDIYEDLYGKMIAVLAAVNANELSRRQKRRDKIDGMGGGSIAAAWMDIDGVLKGDAFDSPDLLELARAHADAIGEILEDYKDNTSDSAEPSPL